MISREFAFLKGFDSDEEVTEGVALDGAVGEVAGPDDVGVSLLLSTDTSKTMATTESTPTTPSTA